MIALETNVLVRSLVADDPRQAAAAQPLVEASCTVDSPAVVALGDVCELVWVLAQGYGYSRDQVTLVLRRLLAAQDLAVERSGRSAPESRTERPVSRRQRGPGQTAEVQSGAGKSGAEVGRT